MSRDELDTAAYEAAHGLPGPLPEGEKLLWQGRPRAAGLARGAFHLRGLAGYFAVLVAWRIVSAWTGGGSIEATALAGGEAVLLAAAALGVLGLLAWLMARTTLYTLTSRRLLIRFGVALPMTINIPLARVGSAGLKLHGDGTGDLPLTLTGSGRVGYLHLWPHVRPWRFARPEPMLRAVADAARVARLLGEALAELHGQEARAMHEQPAVRVVRRRAAPAAA